tara:strand:+ start:40539 stop:41312 length:774 start_codon:yes stop_codon:yes gene_type:complete
MLDIPDNEIHLWFVEHQQITDTDLLEAYRGLLNNEEEKRFQRFVFPKHKLQFLASRALLRTVLADYLDQPPSGLVFARNAYGKPRIASFEMPLPLAFNLSHTNDMTVLAVTQGGEIGVDVEYITRKVDILKLAERYFSAQEASDLKQLGVDKFNQRFIELWTLKEAYIKACGMGLAIPLRDFSFIFKSEGIEISFAEEREDNPEHWRFWQFLHNHQFQIALALKEENNRANKNIIIWSGIPLGSFTEKEVLLTNKSL